MILPASTLTPTAQMPSSSSASCRFVCDVWGAPPSAEGVFTGMILSYLGGQGGGKGGQGGGRGGREGDCASQLSPVNRNNRSKETPRHRDQQQLPTPVLVSLRLVGVLFDLARVLPEHDAAAVPPVKRRLIQYHRVLDIVPEKWVYVKGFYTTGGGAQRA
jgi:hypothetical protein